MADATIAPPKLNARTRMLLEAPLLALLLRLAAPNVLVMVAQAATGLIETYFISRLGTDALAGMSVVFPGWMLMTMMSGGAMGGGISSSIARALGGRRRPDADALVMHAVIINLAFGLSFTAAALLGGPSLYRGLGVEGPSLDAALSYSNVVFGGAALLWVFNALASAIRGTGNMALPAQVICGGVVVLVPLSPCLIFGIGPFPALGVAGGGVAILAYYLVGSLIFARHLANGAGAVSFRWVRPQWRYFRDILSVGAVAILVTLQTYLTISFATAEVGQISPQAVAGFGTGNRLEYLLVPLIFGLGGPLVAIVGTCIGAGKHARAIRAAWLGAAVSTALAEAIGIAASLWPVSWLGLFGHDAAMLESGAAYLRIVGPFYGFFGLGMALYFASQGAGRLLWPLTAGVFRLLIVVGCGAASLRFGFGLRGLFFSLAAGLTVFGLVNAASVARGTWVRKTA